MSKITLHLQLLEDEYNSLSEIVEYYKPAIEPNNPPNEESEIRVYCQQRLCELQNALDNVQTKLSNLEVAYRNIMQMYTEASKVDKKDMLSELEELKQKKDFRALKQEAENIIMALKTRVRETHTQQTILDLNKAQQEVKSPADHANTTGIDFYDPCGLLQNNNSPDTRHTTGERTMTQQRELELTPALKINYPQVKLPYFDGDNISWEEFWDTYSLIIDQNTRLGHLEKILYLKDAIRGKALNAIKSIPMKASNYPLIVDILHKKYGNKGNNRSQIVQRLLKLPKESRTAMECAETLEKVSDLVYQMVATGYDIREKHEPFWIDTILSKFPYDIVKQIMTRSSDGDQLTIGTLIDDLNQEISNRVIFENRYTSVTGTRKNISQGLGPSRPVKTEECLFCHRTNHQTKDCRTVKTAVERRSALRGQSICWKCFAQDHRSRACTQQNCSKCKGDHHISLCTKDQTQSAQGIQQRSFDRRLATSTNTSRDTVADTCLTQSSYIVTESVEEKEKDTTVRSFSNQTDGLDNKRQLVLMTAVAQIRNNRTNSFENVMIFLDSGAQRNLINASLANLLGLDKGESYNCTMHGIGGNVETYVAHQVTGTFRTRFGDDISLNLITKPLLTNAFPAATLSQKDIHFLKQNQIFLSNTTINGEYVKPSVLIGVESYEQVVCLNVPPTKLPSGLLIQSTVFGQALFGTSKSELLIESQHLTTTICPEIVTNIKQELRDLYELEGMGINTDEYQAEDTAYDYMNNFCKLITIEDGAITAPFPLKDNVVDLADNYKVAVSRLHALHKFHMTHKEQKQWYTKILDDYQRNDVIEEITPQERAHNDKLVFYLPHSGVWRSEKTTPLRIVFDASAKAKGKPSLNDVMHTGESFVNKIQDILTKSRWCTILITGDIQAAFTQIRVIPEHRDLLRFLWLKDPNQPPNPNNLLHYRFKRLPFGTKASPSILNMTLATFLTRQNTDLSREILDNIYVDNVFLNAENIEEAQNKIEESRKLFSLIGMNLREFSSNSDRVNETIPKEIKGKTGAVKILGVSYDTASDEISLHLSPPAKEKMTKRELVSEIHKIYDPLGLAIPLLLKLKILMRDVVSQKSPWNQTLSKSQIDTWNEISTELRNTLIRVPRNIGPPNADNACAILWIFGDASQLAVACCSYITHPSNMYNRGLVCAKARLAPTKRNLSIPRLELLAILISSRLAKTMLHSYRNRVQYLHIVSDSKIALAWLQSTRRLPVFVANQVDRINKIRQQIQNTGVILQFDYIDSEHNPADVATRPTTKDQFEGSEWLRGPRWLDLPEEKWPVQPLSSDGSSIASAQHIAINNNMTNCASAPAAPLQQLHTIIDPSRFRHYSQALRVHTRAMKALARWTSRTAERTKKNIDTKLIHRFCASDEPSAEEIKLSETILLCAEANKTDIEHLQSKHKDKQLFLDENQIIRAKSRLNNAAFPRDTREPIYLSRKSQLLRLIVNEIHETNMHCGRNHTLSLLRMKFWIPQPSTTVRKILNQCTICKKAQGLPFPHPTMGPLPKDRVTVCKPFQHVGCDYIGPFTTDNNETAYIALYTCLTTRAIHLELVDNLSASAFLESFIRFISRRGVPSLIRSDCGTNFVLGAKLIQALFDKDESSGHSVMSYSAIKNIKWIFNPPAAPWMGGVWERLVGTVKKCLTKTIGRKRLSYKKLATAITCIEAVVNTRPLTKLDPNDLTSVPLRPVDFLQGNIQFTLPKPPDQNEGNDPTYEESTITTVEQAKEAFKFAEEIANHFWKRWHIEYLTELRDAQKAVASQGKRSSRTLPELGEIVLIQQDECVPRNHWPLGRILELVKSSDGLIRSARILTQSGNIWYRPIVKLIPLEIRSTIEKPNTQSCREVQDTTNVTPRRVMPPRKAKENVRYHDNMQENHFSCSTVHKTISALRNILYPLMLLLTAVVSNAYPISCRDGVVTIKPLSPTYTLCFNNACHNRSSDQSTVFQLPPSMHDDTINISMSSHHPLVALRETKICARQSFCSNKTLFTMALLRNPHCWPVGATFSVVLLVTIPALLIVLLIVCIRNKLSRRHSNRSTSHDRSATSFSLKDLEPSKLVSVGLTAIVLTSVGTSACERTHTRHNTEIICDGDNICTVEYEQELMFNKLNREACILLQYRNHSVGIMKLTVSRTRLSCNKQSLFYTRDTVTEVFYEKRCRFMGSCFPEGCPPLENSTVPELAEANSYPGYSMCASVCGGLACGCLTPLPSCLFYRVTHVPLNEDVYHVFRCTSWDLTIDAVHEFSSPDTTTNTPLRLHPYVATSSGGWDLKVLSTHHPPNPFISRRFAASVRKQLILNDDFKFPTKCHDANTAIRSFNTCQNEIFCACTTNTDKVQCACPQFKALRNGTTQLPLVTPHFNITATSTAVMETNYAEITILVSSKKKIQFAQLVVDPPCSVRVSAVTGCYSCLEAAKALAYCQSEKRRRVILVCPKQSYLVECSPQNETNTLLMEYDQAHVQEQCNYHCGGKTTTIYVKGILFYHNSITDHEIFLGESRKHMQGNWWNISIPDWKPLFLTLADHWRMILATVAGMSALALSVYLCGPVVIITLFKIVGAFAQTVTEVLFTCLSKLLNALCARSCQ